MHIAEAQLASAIAPGGAAEIHAPQATAAAPGLAPAWGGAGAKLGSSGANFGASGGFAAPGAAWAPGGRAGSDPTPPYSSFGPAGGAVSDPGAEQLMQGCPQPSELAATAATVQALLVAGKRVEALRCVWCEYII